MEASASSEAVERANELYWGSDRSVNQIADDLDLSKGALYALIEPFPAESACPRCGAEVVYTNRTRKERGRPECPECDWDGSADETVAVNAEDDGALERAEPAPPSRFAAASGNARVIVGGALLGAAVGLALVMWARRR